MNICSKCGAEMGSDWRYCKICGSGAPKNMTAELQQKKGRVVSEERRWVKPALLSAGVVFAVLSAWILYATFTTTSPSGSSRDGSTASSTDTSAEKTHVLVGRENGVVRIPITDLDEKTLPLYRYQYKGKEIKFFLLRASDGSVRAALDACTACYREKRGYRQDDALVICNNCGISFRTDDVGRLSGGCNPVPIMGTVEGQHVVLQARDLEAGARFF